MDITIGTPIGIGVHMVLRMEVFSMGKRAKWITAGIVVFLICLMCGIGASAETSGTCGDNLTWVLDDEGTLTISGTGNMTSHPWNAASVNAVVIEEGVTSIGSQAFNKCVSLSTITIPDSITSIGYDAFYDCSSW